MMRQKERIQLIAGCRIFKERLEYWGAALEDLGDVIEVRPQAISEGMEACATLTRTLNEIEEAVKRIR